MARPMPSCMTAIVGLALLGAIPASVIYAASDSEDLAIAKSLADMLFAGEAVISKEQDRINNPNLGDKGLSGATLIEHTREIYRTTTGVDPATGRPSLATWPTAARPNGRNCGSNGRKSANDQRDRDRVQGIYSVSIRAPSRRSL